MWLDIVKLIYNKRVGSKDIVQTINVFQLLRAIEAYKY